MTSKISFVKLMQEDFKRRSWGAVFLAVLFFLAYPAAVMMNLDSMMDTRSGVVYTTTEIIHWLKYFLGFDFGMHFALVIAAAVLIGTAEFSYLHSKEQLDLYYSLPIRRKRLFMSGYATGAAVFVVILAVSQVLTLLVLGMEGMLFRELVYLTAKTMLFRVISFLFLYHLVIFAMEFTGKTVLALMGMLILAVYGPVLVIIFSTLAEIGLYTMTTLNVSWYINNTTPIGILYSLGDCLWNEVPYLTQAVLVTLGTVGMFCLDLWMCEHRRTEHAGMSLAFPKMEQILKFLLVLPGAMVIGFLAYGMAGEGKYTWIFAGFLFGVVVLSVLMEFIYHKDMKMILRHKLGLGVTAAAGILLISAFMFDWMGYNSWLPAKEEIRAMSVYGADGFTGYGAGSEVQYDLDGDNYKYEDAYERMRKTGTEDIDLLYELAQEGAACGRYTGEDWKEMQVQFVLKDGKEKLRSYRLPQGVYEEAEIKLYEEAWYREMCYPLLAEDGEERIPYVTGVELINNSGLLTNISGEKAKELLAVYREELAGMSVEDLKQIDTEDMDSYVDINIMIEKDGKHYTLSGYPMNKKFEKTLELSGWQEQMEETETNVN